MVLFLLIKQGQLALQLSKLADEREAEDSERGTAAVRIRRLRDAYQGVGRDLLELLRFVDLNATGLRKILKKFDKRVGYRLSDEYVATRSNHPYSQLQQIFRHVVNCALFLYSGIKMSPFQSIHTNLVLFEVACCQDRCIAFMISKKCSVQWF